MLQLLKKHLLYLCLTTVVNITARVASAQDKPIQISVTANYNDEDFRWSIAGNMQGEKPNILSELIWKDIKGPGMQVGANWNIWKRILVQAYFSKTVIVAGSSTDTDYEKDNRTAPLVQIKAKSNKGYIDFAQLGLGYKLIDNKKFKANTYLGYGINRQLLFLLDADDDTEQPNHRLNSTYAASWTGFFIRMTPQISMSKKMTLKNRLTYNQVVYKGEANWNLIQDFKHPVSFKHIANGYGIDEQLELSLKVASMVSIKLSGNYYYWETGIGVDKLYLSNGNSVNTRFNRTVRNGVGFALGFLWDL